MPNWNPFKKSLPETFKLFKLAYMDESIYGVTAESAQEAEEIVCEEIFHNQTIPGFPEVTHLSKAQLKAEFEGVKWEKVITKGIWYPEVS